MDTQNTKISPYDTAYQQKMAQEQKAQATTPIYKKPTLAEKTKGAVQDTKNKIEQKNETARQAYNKPTPEYPTNTMPTETEDELQKAIDGIDFTKKGAEAGATASQSIQDAEMPKYKRATFKDILFDPQFEGKRDSLLANAIGTALGSGIARIGGTDLGVKSALQQYNEAQAQNYAQMQADKDQRALEADIASRETMNAQKVAMEARLADTVADRYIKEYNATEDAKIKKEVLNQMSKDSELWANLGDKEKLDLAAYMGIVSGNYSLTDLLIQKYAPNMLDMLDALMDKLTNGEWSKLRGKKPTNTDNPDSPTEEPQKKKITNSLGQVITEEDFSDPNKKYRIVQVPLGMGKYETVMLPGFLDDRKTIESFYDNVADMIVNNHNLTPDDAREIMKEIERDWYVPYAISQAKGSIEKKLKEKEEKEKANAKAETAAATAESNFINALQGIRDNTKLTPQQRLDKLNALDPSVTQDPVYTNLYNTQLKMAQEGLAKEEFDRKVATANKTLSNITFNYGDMKGSLDKLKAFKENNSSIIAQSPELKQKVDDMEQKIYTKSTLIPAEKTINTALTTALAGKNATGRYTISDEGYLSQGGFGAIDPGTYDTRYANKVAKGLTNAMAIIGKEGYGIPDQIIKDIDPDGNLTTNGIKYYITQSNAFKAAKRLVNCKYYQKAKNQDEDYKNLKAMIEFYEKKD